MADSFGWEGLEDFGRFLIRFLCDGEEMRCERLGGEGVKQSLVVFLVQPFRTAGLRIVRFMFFIEWVADMMVGWRLGGLQLVGI